MNYEPPTITGTTVFFFQSRGMNWWVQEGQRKLSSHIRDTASPKLKKYVLCSFVRLVNSAVEALQTMKCVWGHRACPLEVFTVCWRLLRFDLLDSAQSKSSFLSLEIKLHLPFFMLVFGIASDGMEGNRIAQIWRGASRSVRLGLS